MEVLVVCPSKTVGAIKWHLYNPDSERTICGKSLTSFDERIVDLKKIIESQTMCEICEFSGLKMAISNNLNISKDVMDKIFLKHSYVYNDGKKLSKTS